MQFAFPVVTYDKITYKLRKIWFKQENSINKFVSLSYKLILSRGINVQHKRQWIKKDESLQPTPNFALMLVGRSSTHDAFRFLYRRRNRKCTFLFPASSMYSWMCDLKASINCQKETCLPSWQILAGYIIEQQHF